MISVMAILSYAVALPAISTAFAALSSAPAGGAPSIASFADLNAAIQVAYASAPGTRVPLTPASAPAPVQARLPGEQPLRLVATAPQLQLQLQSAGPKWLTTTSSGTISLADLPDPAGILAYARCNITFYNSSIYATTSALPAPSGDFTVVAIVRIDAIPNGWHRVADQGRASVANFWFLTTKSQPRLLWGIGYQDGTASEWSFLNVGMGEWHAYAFGINGSGGSPSAGTAFTWMDGATLSTQAIAKTRKVAPLNFTVGTRPDDLSDKAPFAVSAIYVYGRALTPAELAAAASGNPPLQGLQAAYEGLWYPSLPLNSPAPGGGWAGAWKDASGNGRDMYFASQTGSVWAGAYPSAVQYVGYAVDLSFQRPQGDASAAERTPGGVAFR